MEALPQQHIMEVSLRDYARKELGTVTVTVSHTLERIDKISKDCLCTLFFANAGLSHLRSRFSLEQPTFNEDRIQFMVKAKSPETTGRFIKTVFKIL